MTPTKLSHQVMPRAASSWNPSAAETANAVAPEKPSTGTQTLSPESCAG